MTKWTAVWYIGVPLALVVAILSALMLLRGPDAKLLKESQKSGGAAWIKGDKPK